MKKLFLIVFIAFGFCANAQRIREFSVDTSVYPVKILLKMVADDTTSINRINQTNTGDSLNTYNIDVIFKGCAVRGGLNFIDTSLYIFDSTAFALKLTTVLDTFYLCGYPDPEGDPIRVDSFYVNYNTAVSVGEIDNPLKIYPNPSSQYLFVKGIKASANYQIINSLGKVIKTDNVLSEKINIEGIKSGFYYLRIIQDEKQEIFEFLKE